MTESEGKEIIQKIERKAYRKLSKGGFSSYAEGKNYGIMVMFEIAKVAVESRIENEKKGENTDD